MEIVEGHEAREIDALAREELDGPARDAGRESLQRRERAERDRIGLDASAFARPVVGPLVRRPDGAAATLPERGLRARKDAQRKRDREREEAEDGEHSTQRTIGPADRFPV